MGPLSGGQHSQTLNKHSVKSREKFPWGISGGAVSSVGNSVVYVSMEYVVLSVCDGEEVSIITSVVSSVYGDGVVVVVRLTPPPLPARGGFLVL